MGIGRMDFIRLTALALVGTAIDPLQAVATNDDFYINKKLGILFRKPTAWGFIRVADFGKLKDAQLLADEWEDHKQEVYEELGDPVCIATKYYKELPEEKGIFSPTITLNVAPKQQLEDIGCFTFEQMLRDSESGIARLLPEFNVVKRYEPYEISGCDAREFDSEYEFHHIDLETPLKVEMKTIHIEHNGFYYSFNCHQSAAQNQTADEEFAAFKRSIRLL